MSKRGKLESQKFIIRHENNTSFYVNEYKILQKFASGQQSHVFLVTKNEKKYVLSIMQNNAQSISRLNIMLKLRENNIHGVVQLIEYSKNIDVQNFQFCNMKMYFSDLDLNNSIIIIQKYCRYKEISQFTFKKQNKIQSSNILNQHEYNKCMQLFAKLVQTVKQLHDLQIYHFDLKPENILADQDNFVILDFGSVPDKMIQLNTAFDCLLCADNKAAFVLNTTLRFSPERYDMQQNRYFICDYFDVYSLGCVLFYLLTNRYLDGHLKFDSEGFRTLSLNYNFLVADLISGMTTKQTLLRYQLVDVLQHPALSIFVDNNKSDAQQETSDQESQPTSLLSSQDPLNCVLTGNKSANLVKIINNTSTSSMSEVLMYSGNTFTTNSTNLSDKEAVILQNASKMKKSQLGRNSATCLIDGLDITTTTSNATLNITPPLQQLYLFHFNFKNRLMKTMQKNLISRYKAYLKTENNKNSLQKPNKLFRSQSTYSYKMVYKQKYFDDHSCLQMQNLVRHFEIRQLEQVDFRRFGKSYKHQLYSECQEISDANLLSMNLASYYYNVQYITIFKQLELDQIKRLGGGHRFQQLRTETSLADKAFCQLNSGSESTSGELTFCDSDEDIQKSEDNFYSSAAIKSHISISSVNRRSTTNVSFNLVRSPKQGSGSFSYLNGSESTYFDFRKESMEIKNEFEDFLQIKAVQDEAIVRQFDLFGLDDDDNEDNQVTNDGSQKKISQ